MELGRKLRRKGLVVRDHERRTLHLRDHVRHRVGLARTRHAQQCLMLQVALDRPFHKAGDCVRLIAARDEFMVKLEVAERC